MSSIGRKLNAEIVSPSVKKEEDANDPEGLNLPVSPVNRERFRRYLEKSGVMEAMNQALVNVCKDSRIPLGDAPPDDVLAGFLEELSFGMPIKYVNVMLKNEKAYLESELAVLNQESAKLSEVIDRHKKDVAANRRDRDGSDSESSETESVTTEIDTEYELLEGSESSSVIPWAKP